MNDRLTTDTPEAVIQKIAELIGGLRFGMIEIVVHDGRVVQIQRREKIRFSKDAAKSATDSRGGDG